jgi:AraC family transcriptional regulator, regulatory protein of adaptative response / methylated-DNA-[protein]-cysteine methyltransferase
MRDKELHYNRIKEAIEFIQKNFRSQPRLEDIAERVHLSPYHFQRLFTEWAGVSPKKFLQFISVEHAKSVLHRREVTVADAAHDVGLSGTGRLHDLFVNIEGMTPGEFKNGGESLSINYSFAQSPFGELLVASTAKGICFMAFADDREKVFNDLTCQFPKAVLVQTVDFLQQNALYIFTHDWSKLDTIKLHLKATDFQLKVWQTLLQIPFGNLTTYGAIAKNINHPGASRAVGTAIGSNPVAYLIPCHRVIQSSGMTGQYMWGAVRKTAIIGWEAAKTSK